jgi:hypothetical protein
VVFWLLSPVAATHVTCFNIKIVCILPTVCSHFTWLSQSTANDLCTRESIIFQVGTIFFNNIWTSYFKRWIQVSTYPEVLRPAILTYVFLFFTCLHANTELGHNIPSCYCMRFMQLSRFQCIKINPF